MEGVIAKLASSPYVQKRSRNWLKMKTVLRQEVVIAGYTRPRGTRTHLGALIVGLYSNGVLTYVGHVGGGFNEENLEQVYSLLQRLKTKVCPFLVVPKTLAEVNRFPLAE